MRNPRIHNVVAWTTILTFGFLAFLPSVLFAQFSPPPDGFQMPPGADDCSMKCQAAANSCMTSAGQDQAAMEKCRPTADACFASCRNATGGSQMPPSGFPPPSGSQQPPTGFQPPSGGMGGPGDTGGQNGTSEEKMKAMQEMGFQNMQRQIATFGKQLGRIKSRIATLEKKGVKAPQDLADALAKADELIAKMKAAKSFNDLGDAADIGDVLQDVSETVQDRLPTMERLANLPKIYARIDKQLKTFDRQLAADKKAAASSKIDLSKAVGDVEAALNTVKAAYADAKAKIAGDDADAGFDELQGDVFDGFAGVAQAHAVFQQVRQLRTSMIQGARQLTQFQNTLDRLKKRGKDTTAAQEVLAEGKAKFEELKTAAAAQPFDAENVAGLLGYLADIRDKFTAELDELNGVPESKDIDAGLPTQSLDLSGFGGLVDKPDPQAGNTDMPPSAAIVVQAETGKLGGNVGSMTLMGKTSTTPGTHEGYLYMGDGGATVTYTFQAPAAGDYALLFRFSDDGKHADGARSVSVSVNGGAAQTWSNKSQDTKGWVYVKLGMVTLKQGANTAVFTKAATTSAAFVMDDFILSNDPSHQPK